MPSTPRTIGDLAEEKALAYLTKKGLKFIAKNFSCKLGEIDLIMQDKEHIVFVEVRYRSKSSHGSAIESISKGKQLKIIRTATLYLLQQNKLYKVNGRFDVIAIDFTNQEEQIHWFENAFTT